MKKRAQKGKKRKKERKKGRKKERKKERLKERLKESRQDVFERELTQQNKRDNWIRPNWNKRTKG